MKTPAELSDVELLAVAADINVQVNALADDIDARVNGLEGGPNHPEMVAALQELLALRALREPYQLEMRRRAELFTETAAAVELDDVLGEILDEGEEGP
jgi:glycosyltransferase involved in cell wall biosynthesis